MSRIVLGCLLLLFISASGQDPLTNDAIVKLVRSGISEVVVVDMVNHRPGKYALGVDDIIGLKQAGVSDKIISAMIAKERGGSGAPSAVSEAAPPSPSLQDLDLGVYIRRQDKLVEVAPEIVTWRTGGVLKSLATVGLTKGHVNGVVQNPGSTLQDGDSLGL